MRPAALALLLLVLAAVAAVAATPAPACGCGALVADRETSGQRVDEWSLVAFDGREETILMRLSLGVPLDRAALVLPVRPGATAALGDDGAFERVRELTAPRVETRKRYRLFGDLGAGGSDDGATAPGALGAGAVEVVRSQDLGPLRVVTLRSRSARALETWLRANRFPLPGGLTGATQAYLDTGWDLLVARLRPATAGTPLRELQPLAIRFPATAPVYPLRLSRLSAAGSAARVDLFAAHRLDVRGYGRVAEARPGRASPGAGVSLLFAGRVAPGAGGRALGPQTPRTPFLTSYRFQVDRGSPDRDPAFVRAAADTPYRQVRIRYDDVNWLILPLLLGLAIAGGLAVAALLVVRRRRTR